MRRSPLRGDGILLRGMYSLNASMDGFPVIKKDYELSIQCPSTRISSFKVIETGGDIPREDKFHVNPDGTLCLGSPLTVQLRCGGTCGALDTYADECITPFLYSVSIFEKTGIFPYGELSHGKAGLIEDYIEIFEAPGNKEMVSILALLSMKKREANKQTCPWGCGQRIGSCTHKNRIAQLRSMLPRRSFREELQTFSSDISKWKAEERLSRERKRKKRG
ncbi:MAG: hypothetical protein Hals2KO_37080 [Halioglobus sp.]